MPDRTHAMRAVPTTARDERDFLGNLTQAVQDNPISAALIGMGALWLLAGGSKTSLLGNGGKSIFRSHDPAVASGHGADWVRGLVASGNDDAMGVGSMGSRIGGVTRIATTALGEAAAAVHRTASESASQAVDSVSSTYDAGLTNTSKALQGAKYRLSGLQQGLAETFERQPLLLGAIGLAVGAGIAAALPGTDAENRLMGDTSEVVKSQVKDFVDDKSRQAEVATRDVIRDVSTVPDAAGQALKDVSDKLARVADAGRKEVVKQLKGGKPKGRPAGQSI
jgi:hypothetical protein